MVFTITHICSICQVLMSHLKTHSEPCRTSKMAGIVKIVLAINYFRYLRQLWIRCHLRQKLSFCKLNQVNKEQITTKVWRFSLRDSSDEDGVFAGLKFFLLFYKFFLLNKFLQSEVMQKSRSVQNITNIIAVADK